MRHRSARHVRRNASGESRAGNGYLVAVAVNKAYQRVQEERQQFRFFKAVSVNHVRPDILHPDGYGDASQLAQQHRRQGQGKRPGLVNEDAVIGAGLERRNKAASDGKTEIIQEFEEKRIPVAGDGKEPGDIYILPRFRRQREVGITREELPERVAGRLRQHVHLEITGSPLGGQVVNYEFLGIEPLGYN